MELQFFNTMNRRVEPFRSINPGEVRMYTCGPTVYNYAHIGNFRAYMFEDLLRRTLEFFGYRVRQVMNLTDVDDKTIRDSRAAGIPLRDFTQKYKQAFFEDLKTLNIEPAEVYPAATDHIPQMIRLISILMEKGFGYRAEDGSVYFSIEKFPDYGKLAKIDRENQRSGVRIKNDEYAKDSVADFALWKAWDELDGDVAWDSPWGRGRPGWHIECSAMSSEYLGDSFDIHTGGIDNMFPHHEDEIAQSEAATGKKWVNYWLHCAHLMVNGEKMSKSLGNFYTLRDLEAMGWRGREIRWVLLGAHYRKSSISRWRPSARRVKRSAASMSSSPGCAESPLLVTAQRRKLRSRLPGRRLPPPWLTTSMYRRRSPRCLNCFAPETNSRTAELFPPSEPGRFWAHSGSSTGSSAALNRIGFSRRRFLLRSWQWRKPAPQPAKRRISRKAIGSAEKSPGSVMSWKMFPAARFA